MAHTPDRVPCPRFSLSVDQSIIHGYLGNRRAMFTSLCSRGFSRQAITDRARELGLSDQFIKRCAVGNPDVAMRTCLQCNTTFLSMGPQNRLCPRCKKRN